ncbi:bifunctional (p)ppGpp synthetase/guanosine-3',5'-bis(diphosphate) 3'-pyrophosphohydrolase [Paroceanicella profunda]|uniref:GTP pyrophosphokinase rsh n=1 Tax=Paroceanicella profunda TaxID=2579971 RepID=A0A5B8FUY1_9RHOB|nr:bifunctional (p)ppGpp synthetase/guanosine-3',5'-bis(diphosphate) 3'-pyrophosphohydrolase [Paroceanicella profunda]QDL92175.1 bifunctional (p)ppGpp synthetase/guanosine-3',5'-bis(diphosphate) 3'-pyrophosphohydrolase [Paroceanicella profunda]
MTKQGGSRTLAAPDEPLAGVKGVVTRPDELIDLVKAYNPNTDEALIERAWVYGARAHAGQFRASGEPYYNHPIEVAKMLTSLRLDDSTIVTALLHDTVEDNAGCTTEEVAEIFGEEIAHLVDGVTKLTKLQIGSRETEQAENFRKLLMAMSRDVRVLLVKLADRLHNMRTIKHLKPYKQEKKARETMDIYAPLAGRMGMQWMREELEDLSFQVLNPDARKSIIHRFATLRKESGDLISQITDDINSALANSGVEAEVYGREKRPYSIWRKMEAKGEAFHRLSDIYGFRIITRSVDDAYRALGAVHRRWVAVPGRFKDYISQPKSNGYRSLHTTVSGRNAKRVEVQIRTREMHEVAEAGVAAHWAYRDGVPSDNPFAVDPFRWVRQLAEEIETTENPAELLEHVKLEMFQDQVFCFTPKGEVVKLPRGATPIDFAYAIHTRIGHSCVGSKVDGRRVPLWTKLKNGQAVEIIRAEGQRPQSSWEEIVVTGRAKSAIRRALKNDRRAADIRMGREIARIAFERIGKQATDKALDTAARSLAIGRGDDLLAKLGSAEITGHEVVASLYPDIATPTVSEPLRDSVDGPIYIGLAAGQDAIAGPCCNPLPGERIIGIAERGRGVVIHAIDCPSLGAFEDQMERWIDLRWNPDAGRGPSNHALLEVVLANDPGALGRVCTLIGELGANISDIDFAERKTDFYRLHVDLELRDVKHLHHIIRALEAESVITQVTRVRQSAVGVTDGVE